MTRFRGDSRHERLVEAHRPIVDYLVRNSLGSRPITFLDYGFGSGEFLLQVAESGHTATGVEFSSRAVTDLSRSAERRRLSIQAMEIAGPEDLSRTLTTVCDVVTLFQVVEHLLEPLAVIRSLAAHQRAGGLLYIECPNNSGLQAWLKGLLRAGDSTRMWRSLKHPEHVHGFSRRSLTALLQHVGYDVLECGDYAYGDGVHQVESEFWWPSWSESVDLRSVRGITRPVIPLFDRLIARPLRSGSGLFALGRKS